MATYKKRGYKPKTKVEKEAEIIEDSTTAEVFASLDQGASKTEQWVENNQKVIFGVIAGVVIIVLGFLAYNKFVVEPNEIEASEEIAQAQEDFNTALTTTNTAVKDSLYNLALTGSNGKYGLLEIADKYGSTKSGNLAKYYAGMSYLETNRYEEAINFLQDFKSDDMVISPLAEGAIGDAFSELNQNDVAIGHYEKAAAMSTNDFTTPRFLFKAGVAAIELQQYDKAIKYLSRIKDEFSDSDYANQADLYLGKAQAAN